CAKCWYFIWLAPFLGSRFKPVADDPRTISEQVRQHFARIERMAQIRLRLEEIEHARRLRWIRLEAVITGTCPAALICRVSRHPKADCPIAPPAERYFI